MNRSKTPFPEYEKQWEDVESLDKKGQYKSALEIVRQIAAQAQDEGNHPQLIKSFTYRLKYVQILEEDTWVSSFEVLNAEYNSAFQPHRAIYASIIAEYYQAYLERNRWKINQISQISPRPEDFREWATEDFRDVIEHYYLTSLDDELKSTKRSEYNVILSKERKFDDRWPSLYEVAFDRAFNYFNSHLNTSRHTFQLDDRWLKGTSDFVSTSFEDYDGFLKNFTLKLQQYLNELQKQNRSLDLIDLELKRLEMAYSNTLMVEAYLNSLNALSDRFESSEAWSEIEHTRARMIISQRNENNVIDYLKAKEICEKAIDKYPNSYGAELCRGLIQNTILPSRLQFSFETANVPDKPFRILLDYRNVKSVQLEYTKVPAGTAFNQSFNRRNDDALSGFDWTEVGKFDMPSYDDHNDHSVEIGLPALSAGEYVIRLNGDQVNHKSSIVVWNYFNVTDLAFFENRDDDVFEIIVSDRTSGKPVSDVQVRFYETYYDQSSRSSKSRLYNNLKTGNDGRAELAFQKEGKSLTVRLTKGDEDVYFTESNLYVHNNTYTPKPREMVNFYTDRAIYKPGQKVYFKGILIGEHNFERQIIEGKRVEVMLKNTNHQVVDKISIRSNEFGSVSGEFVLPDEVLPGQFYIQVSGDINGQTQFSVENYKRPKIEASFEPSFETYVLGDEITLQLKGQTLYGVPLNDATVRYKIVKRTMIPYYARGGYYSRCYFPWPQEEIVIAQGSTVTNASGLAEITFQTTANNTKKYGLTPWVSFTVEADVIDETGEPTSASKSVTLAESAFRGDISGASEMDISNLSDLKFEVTNFDGQNVDVEGLTYVLDQYQPGNRANLRSRYWQAPDQYYYSEDEFKSKFPLDPYKEEHLMVNWPTRNISKRKLDLGHAWSLELGQIKSPGIYNLTILDENGSKVTQKLLTIYDGSKGQLPAGLNSIKVTSDELELGKNNFSLLTDLDNGAIWVKFSQRPGEWIESTNKSLEVNLTHEDLDRLGLVAVAVRNNRFYSLSRRLRFTENKNINLTIKGIEDEVLPGALQSWEVMTTNEKGEPVEAEVALTVFDAGLDIYRKLNWSASQLNTIYKPYRLSVQGGTFTQAMGRSMRTDYDFFRYEHRIYPQLITFINGRYGNGIRPPIMLQRGSEEKMMMDGVMIEESAAAANVENLEADYDTGDDQSNDVVDVRTDLAELAYWNSNIVTDKNGRARIDFAMKQDLTKWRILGLTHDSDLNAGTFETSVITTKDLLIQPYVPDLLMAGDSVSLSAKISNTGSTVLDATSSIEVTDLMSGEDLSNWITGKVSHVTNIKSGTSETVRWNMAVPSDFTGLIRYRFKTHAGSINDGEEGFIYVKNDRQNFTETHSFFLKPGESITMLVDSLDFHMPGTDTQHEDMSLETISGPEWYALQAMPYAARKTNPGIGNITNALYINSLSSFYLKENPWLKEAIASINKESPLLKKESYKLTSNDLTPWQREAIEEEDRLAMLSLFLDDEQIQKDLEALRKELSERQLVNGGFSWTPGGRDSWYMSLHVLDKAARLQDKTGMKILDNDQFRQLEKYCQNRMKEYCEKIIKTSDKNIQFTPSQQVIRQLYALILIDKDRSWTKEEEYFFERAVKNWLQQDLYNQSLIAHILFRKGGHLAQLNDMMQSFKERMIDGGDRGLFWKHHGQSPYSESYFMAHASLVDLFYEFDESEKVFGLLTFIIQHKRTNSWENQDATIAAIDALLKGGFNQKASLPLTVQINGLDVDVSDYSQAHTLWKMTSLDQSTHPGKNARITITNPNDKVAWGSLYWQFSDNPSNLKDVYSEKLSVNQSFLSEIDADRPLVKRETFQLGDRVFVQLSIETDRPMEYVMVEDDRPAGIHPGIQLSGREYNGGLSYYKAFQPTSTQFFINSLPRGKYVLEYEMTASHIGNFSAGLTKIQSLYAPEFGGHTAGRHIKIKNENE